MKAVLRSNPSDIKKKSQYVLHLKGIVVETVVPANVEDLWFPEESVAVFAHATLGNELLPSIKIMNINACARKKINNFYFGTSYKRRFSLPAHCRRHHRHS